MVAEDGKIELSEKRPDSAAPAEPSPGEQAGRRRGRRPAPTDRYRFVLIALDRASGETVWQKVLREEVPHEGSHEDGSLAPASPLTDGDHIIAYFGSRGLYCLSMGGDLVWEQDLGDMKTRNGFGEGSTPALYRDTLIVNWDHEADSFIVALDKKTGRELWRRSRDEPTSWSSPLIVEDGQRVQVIVSAAKRVRSYDLASGDLIWECAGLGANCTPTPVADGELVYTMSGFRDEALLAIRYKGATGDLSGTDAVAWKLDKATPYVPSPVLYGGTLYFLQKNTGILSSYEARTGQPRYSQQRLADIEGVYASPVGAADRLYVTGRNGATCVVRHGSDFEVLAFNKLEDEFSASPAIAGNELFLRGRKHLYCIAAQ
jgi:outer membrane protein assembly factor BamB